jgi:peptide chain release factor subunit 1
MSEYDTDVHRRLSQVSSAGGEGLVSVAIPPDGSLGEIRKRVQKDHAKADYIDADESTRPERAALEATRGVLGGYEKLPETGLVVYAGTIAGESEPVEYVFDDLPTPVAETVYEQGNAFVTEPLETVFGPTAVFGLIVVERGGAALGRMEGEAVTPLAEFESGVMGKTRAGGQSAERFARRRAEQTEEFFDRVADEAERLFVEEGEADGILLGGTEVTVEQFREGDYLPNELAADVLGTFSVEYAGEQGLSELGRKARERREEFERRPGETALEEFFQGLGDAETPVAYGPADTDEALEYDAVERLLVSTELRAERIRTLQERAEESGAEVVFVPEALERGERFREVFGGVGALLRFSVE